MAEDVTRIDETTAAALFLYLLIHADLRRRVDSARHLHRWWPHDKVLKCYDRPTIDSLSRICESMRKRIPSSYKLEALAK